MEGLYVKKTNGYLKPAFSLLEMMVVLLIVAILAAATAPMVTKKMARNAGSGDSPWVFTGLNSSIAYNLNGNDDAPVIIGATSTPASLTAPTRLFIDSGNTASHIAFGNGNATPLGITADPANRRVGISNKTIPNNSVALGASHDYNNEASSLITAIGHGVFAHNKGVTVIGNGACAFGTDSIAIGSQNPTNHEGTYGANSITIGTSAYTVNDGSIAIGNVANAGGSAGVAIGNHATATRDGSIAIGGLVLEAGNPAWGRTVASGEGAIAIGSGVVRNQQVSMSTHTIATGTNSIAIGRTASATGENSVAIGNRARATAPNQIVLGNPETTVYIPGRLVTNYFAVAKSGVFYYSDADKGLEYIYNFRSVDRGKAGKGQTDVAGVVRPSSVTKPDWLNGYELSDRRLKNVGEAYTAGLDELKKLDFFHYTFKKDEAKTPHVGVMAQDLEKVFPDAVTKGEDGYLRIRMEDMFYAVINAVKELDTKIAEIVENVTSLSKKVDEQQQVIDAQQKLIEELQAQNAEFEKRLTKIEKKAK